MNGTQARSNPLPAILAVAGGVIVLITCFLPWGKVTAGQSGLFPEETGNATEFDFGWFAIAAGAALIVAGAVMLARNLPSVWKSMGGVAIAAGLVAILVTGYNIATKDRQVDNAIRDGIEESTGQQLTDQQLEAVKVELERIGIEISLQFGIYLTILGGLVGIVGGLLALRAKETRPVGGMSGFEPSTPAQAAPPPPQPGEAWQPPPPEPPAGQGPEEDRGP